MDKYSSLLEQVLGYLGSSNQATIEERPYLPDVLALYPETFRSSKGLVGYYTRLTNTRQILCSLSRLLDVILGF